MGLRIDGLGFRVEGLGNREGEGVMGFGGQDLGFTCGFRGGVLGVWG